MFEFIVVYLQEILLKLNLHLIYIYLQKSALPSWRKNLNKQHILYLE